MRHLACLLIAAVLTAGCATPAPQPERPPVAPPAPATVPDVPAADPVPAPAPAPEPAPKPVPTPEPETAAAVQPEPAAPAPAPAAPAPSAPAKPAQPVAPPPAAPSAVTKPEAAAASEPAAATSHALAGRLAIAGSQATDLAAAVVYFVPDAGGKRPEPGRFRIYTQGKRFDPELLVVPQGSTVAFPNSDPIRHNVYSRTPGATFDLGFYGEGEAPEQVFDRPGLVVVNCNVHHVMQAQVFVVPSAWYVRPDPNGQWRLDGLPAGRGTLHFWHPRAQPASLVIALPTTLVVERTLAARPGGGR